MGINFRRATSIVSLSFLLSTAGCTVETDGEDPGEVASTEEALCSDRQRVICAVVCRVMSNPPANCVEQCLSGCNQPEPPPTWPWSVSCDARTDSSPTYTDYVGVRASQEPGSDLSTPFVNELLNLAAAPCEALARQYFGNRCSALDRTEFMSVYVARTVSGIGRGPLGPTAYSYDRGSGNRATTIPVADLCPEEPPLPPDDCGPYPCP